MLFFSRPEMWFDPLQLNVAILGVSVTFAFLIEIGFFIGSMDKSS